jgi:hypothetical protein
VNRPRWSGHPDWMLVSGQFHYVAGVSRDFVMSYWLDPTSGSLIWSMSNGVTQGGPNRYLIGVTPISLVAH